MESSIPILETKLYQAIRVGNQYFHGLRCQELGLEELEMHFVDGLYLHIKQARDEYFIFPANIIFLRPWREKMACLAPAKVKKKGAA